MPDPTTQIEPSLYELDETAWLERTSALIARRRFQEIDVENLAEYLSDMARRDKREVRSRMIILIAHLLKWEYQPQQRSPSWRGTIREQRQELEGIFEAMSLRKHAGKVLQQAYKYAVPKAADETGLPADTFPATCPMSLEEILEKPVRV